MKCHPSYKTQPADIRKLRIMAGHARYPRFLSQAIIGFICFISFFTTNIQAQSIIQISSERNVEYRISSNLNESDLRNTMEDDSKWLNFSLVKKSFEPAYSISAQVAPGSIPPGIEIRLRVNPYVGNSRGNHGNPAGEIILSELPQKIIDQIGTCFTGSGIYSGYQLVYSIEIKQFEKLSATNTPISIIFTLTQ